MSKLMVLVAVVVGEFRCEQEVWTRNVGMRCFVVRSLQPAKRGGIEHDCCGLTIVPPPPEHSAGTCAALAATGFRGRQTVVGIDLGTTYSVIGVNEVRTTAKGS